jgi:acetyltransferase
MNRNQLGALLHPSGIAVIGASDDPNKIGGRPIAYLKKYGYRGKIYPVNPKYAEVQQLKCYPSITDVPAEIDLAIIAIPGAHVLDTLHECGRKKVKSVIIFSSGFAELGEEGRSRQREIGKIAEMYGMRIVGPNCQGVANFSIGSLATFSTTFAEGQLEVGPTAIISQSGAVSAMLYNIRKKYGRGSKYWIGTGNEADVNVAELLDCIVDDPDVRVLQLYMEDVKNAGALIAAAGKARERNKPILALKSGRTAEGSQAAQSHTGAMASEDIVFDAVFDNYGIVRLDSVVELAVFSQLFELPNRPKGNRVAVITNSGGLGVMLIDHCKEMGLELARLSEETRQRLAGVLPAFASVRNPVDVATHFLNDRELLAKLLPILTADAGVDIVVIGLGVVGRGYDVPAMIEHIVQYQGNNDAVVAFLGVGCQDDVIASFSRSGVPAFDDPVLCVKAISKYVAYHLDRREAQEEKAATHGATVKPALPKTAGFLSEYEGKRLLKEWGMPVTREMLCADEEEAVRAAATIGYPVVMKISSPYVQHKTDIGGVELNIRDEPQAREAYRRLMENGDRHVGKDNIDGVLVQEMITDRGFEISLGVKRDPAFGPVVMVASGGIYIEVLKDFRLLVPPVTKAKARKAVESLIMAPLLKGARGKKAFDVDALCDAIVSFASLVTQTDAIEEADLNPVIVREQGKGVAVVDCVLKLTSEGA